jgi:hypothetical protein
LHSSRRIRASRANGATSRGPVTPEGKRRSSRNAISHGLLARSIVLDSESPEAFETLFSDHLDRLQPADGVELGMVEEMVAAHWRMRRAWALEARALERSVAAQPPGDPVGRIANAWDGLAQSPTLGLMHRYETRLHLIFQRALHNLLLLRAASPSPPAPAAVVDIVPAPNPRILNEPSPISGHLPEGQVSE